MLEKVRRTPHYRTLITAYRFAAVGVVCGVLAAVAGGVLHQPLPMLVATVGAFLSVAIGLALSVGALPAVYSDIRYASSVRFVLMALRDVVRGVPRIDDPAHRRERMSPPA